MGIKIDITPKDLKTVKDLLKQYLPNTLVWAFGSRVKFTAKPTSDLDLVAFISKEQELKFSLLKEALEESSVPFRIDLHNWNELPETFHKNIESSFVVLQEDAKKEMPSEWKTYKLGDLIEINKKSIGRNYSFSEIEYIDTSSVTENRFSEFQLLKLDEAPSRAKRIVSENDIVYSTVRPIQKHYGIIKKAKSNLVASTGFAVLTAKKIDPNFLYYYLSQDQVVGYLNSVAESNTTTFPAFNASLFETFEIQAPNIETQRQIAQILTSLDDKIELNLQMNQTLEAMAQAIFKEWFVNFNFPGSESEKRKVKSEKSDELSTFHSSLITANGLPKGWRKGKLGDVLEVKGGTTPSTSVDEYWNGENHWTTPKDLSNAQSPVLIDTERKITDLGVKQISSGILPKGTLLLSSRAPIGYLAISQVPISINQGYIAIQGKSVSNLFLLFWLKQNMEAVKSKANGSTFQEISKSNFKLIDISIPSLEVLQKFDEIVEPIFQKIVENVYSNLSLTQTRDTLLPKLMSGVLKVKSEK